MQGMGIQELFDRRFPGVQVDAQYSGFFLLAVKRLQTEILQVVLLKNSCKAGWGKTTLYTVVFNKQLVSFFSLRMPRS